MTKRAIAAILAVSALASCGNPADGTPAASDAATVPTIAATMPPAALDPAATARLRSFAGRDADGDGFISSAENGAAEASIYEAIDRDDDGTMTVTELDAARIALGLVTLPGSDKLIADADQDNDRKLTLAEWMARQGEAFKAADSNRDDKLSEAEYAAQPRLEAPAGAATAEAASTAGAG